MRYQQRAAWCGPAAIVNALRCYGRKLGQARVAKLCGTTSDGTNEHGIIRGLSALGHGHSIFENNERGEASVWLNHAAITPLIICADQWEHWVAVAGVCAGGILLFDSDRTAENRRENGCHPVTVKTLLRRWRAGRKVAEGAPRFYGIAVHGPL